MVGQMQVGWKFMYGCYSDTYLISFAEPLLLPVFLLIYSYVYTYIHLRMYYVLRMI